MPEKTASADVKRPSEIRLRDPISEVTRNERKTLLGMSAVAIVIVRTGLVPSKISALGIDFDRTDQTAVLRMLSAIVLYFLVAFVIYATSDFVAWRVTYFNAMVDWRARSSDDAEGEVVRIREELRKHIYGTDVLFRSTGAVSVIRAVFEFGVPVLIGAYAVLALATAPPPKITSGSATAPPSMSDPSVPSQHQTDANTPKPAPTGPVK